ncbi:MAG: Uma2 family endonuclease [Xenococcus sp. MO_188.B8]|nr:Uma2 family endonuclease [Xenococcus sp. MO_188.B8]
MLLEVKKIIVPPGQTILLRDINWLDFEAILEDLGERRSSRIAYDCGTLSIMTALPEHEVNKVLIGDLLKVLLEELDIDFWSLGSTTFKNKIMKQGIEPDDCFYIKNEALIRGKDRIDLTIDPPPDLAIEVEVTSRSNTNIYAKLGVPELWRFEKGKLKIDILQDGAYVNYDVSSIFPDILLINIIPEYLAKAKENGRNKTMKEFRKFIINNFV